MRTFLLLSFISILLVAMVGPGLVRSVQGEENGELSAVINKEEIDNEVIVTVRIISSWNAGDVSVLVRNDDDIPVLLETTTLEQGYAEVSFRVDPEEGDGKFTAYVSAVDHEGKKTNSASATYIIEPDPEQFLEDWMILMAVGLLLALVIIVKKSRRRKVRTNASIIAPEAPAPPQTDQKQEERSPFQRPLTGSGMPEVVVPRHPVKQEIHHHYAPQYDQSSKTETIVDSVLLKKRP